ncbi:MAG: hypothetical protein ACI4VK_04895 [Candidatus Coproplasma sp.]
MKRMKSKKLNTFLIAAALSTTLVFGGLGIYSINNGNGIENTAYASSTIENKTPEEEAHVYYIGTLADGQQEGDGLSTDSIMSVNKFFSDPVNSLVPGDIVRIMPGEHIFKCTIEYLEDTPGEKVYSGTGNITINVNGSYDDYIIFEAQDPTQKTTLNFKQQSFLSTNRGVQINGNYIYWRNIDVCGAGDNGMYIGGSYNVVENCEFYNNRDTGLQLGRTFSEYTTIDTWPSYNLIKNCTSYNNYDNETYGENADGFAAKLTVGYGNIFDGCIAYRNSDDGWDLYAKADTGNIGAVIMYNCVAFENGFLQYSQKECNDWYTFEDKDGNLISSYNSSFDEPDTTNYVTRDGDGNGFKLGGGTMEGDVFLNNCMSFHNRMHGVTDNSNPGVLSINNVTSYNNGITINQDSTSADYGKIVITGTITDSESVCNNIDIERTTASYNNFTNILSVINGSQLTGSDRYKGSAEYSFLAMTSIKSSKITENIDSDYLNGKRGEEIVAPAASDLFVELPTDDLSLLSLEGREDRLYYVHKTFREADGTINMGNLLKIKDYSLLFGDEHKIGCDLTKTSYEAYPHYSYTYLTDDEITDVTTALLTAVDNMLYLPINPNACYQDFQAPTSIRSCNITWVSSNPDVLKVTDRTTVSLSGSSYVDIEVYRQAVETDVTLTATITPGGNMSGTKTKAFNIKVKVLTNEIGDIEVKDAVDGKIIIDQYSVFELPEVEVLNATDYNGKLIDKNAYTISTKVLYSKQKGAHQVEIKAFTPSVAGVYEIINSVSLDGKVKSYSYNIFVVSGSAEVDFVKDANDNPDVSVGVDYDGFYITGNLNNVSGTLYAMVSDTEPTANQLIANGDSYKITSDYLYANFEQDNKSEYTIYYVICNPNGTATSPVYSTTVEMVQINSEDDFSALLKTGGETNKIYQLSRDLDYKNKTWSIDAQPFVGYFDGNNHTISGINVTADKDGLASVFYQLNGGTIVNVNFNDINLKGKQNVGIIGSAYSGRVSNVKITNINIVGDQRIGGLIGRAYEQIGAPLIIDRVSVINTDNTLRIMGTGGSSRAAGIIGFMQNNAAYKSDFIDIRISNCYVDAIIGTATTKENGGIFAVFDDAYNPQLKHSLEITKCVFAGTVYSQTRCGGILAYQKGVDKVTISYCVSYGTLYHAGMSTPVETAQKNCSGIFGGYSANANTEVFNCFAKFEEHNQSYSVEPIAQSRVETVTFWKNYVRLDTSIWEIVQDGDNVVAPYVRLK